MAKKKPANLIYSVDEVPPWGTTILLGLQHVFVISVGWIFVLVVVTGMGGTETQAANIIRISMIASGIATILQALTKGPVGSGYLCPLSCGPAYIAASILAGKAGGLPLVFGLTSVSGLFEALLSRAMQRLRVLFPPEVTGLVVAMVGLELISLAVPRVMGFNGPGSGLNGRSVLVALATLAIMIAPSVWSKGKLRLYPVLLGLGAGYLGSYVAGLLTSHQIEAALSVPLITVPQKAGGWSFSFALLPLFLVAGLSSTLKSVGDLTLCQKINDTDWKRTDMRSVSGGILAGSICTISAGLFGGIGQSTFSSNVGLSIATGATSRRIAYPCGIILILLAFFPKLASIFTVMPAPVMGAVLVYVACFMILSGIQVITSRMLDARKTFVVGISLIFGLSVEMVPGLYAGVPDALRPLFSSSLSLATVLVIVLNVLFRIGVGKRQKLELSSGSDNSETIFQFMENQGGAWGARREVIQRAMSAMNEFMESSNELGLKEKTVAMEISFDEFNLDVQIQYKGPLMDFPATRPTKSDLKLDEGATLRLSGFMIRQYCDSLKASREGEISRISLHFTH